jgi:hypothetical protein
MSIPESGRKDLIVIKNTQFCRMYHDPVNNGVWIITQDFKMYIPESKVPQIQRGLISEFQKFYRKNVKHDIKKTA